MTPVREVGHGTQKQRWHWDRRVFGWCPRYLPAEAASAATALVRLKQDAAHFIHALKVAPAGLKDAVSEQQRSQSDPPLIAHVSSGEVDIDGLDQRGIHAIHLR